MLRLFRSRFFLAHHTYHSSFRSITTLGIRREDPSRVWERRSPLTPQAVSSLLFETKPAELRVEVESCRRRCFLDEQYLQVSHVSSRVARLRDAGRPVRMSFQASRPMWISF